MKKFDFGKKTTYRAWQNTMKSKLESSLNHYNLELEKSDRLGDKTTELTRRIQFYRAYTLLELERYREASDNFQGTTELIPNWSL